MGFGSFGNGGSSSSSSNLSALAPPFTVDRPVSKPLSNPLVNFTESTYAAPFNSSLHNWVHPQSPVSRPDYFSNPNSAVDSVQATGVPPSNAYRYSVSQPVNSPVVHLPPLSHIVSGIAHLPPLSPIVSAGTDVFSFGQCSDRMKTSLVEAKPYYPPYVAPAIEDNSPLVVLNEPNYDLLSTSHAAHLNGSSSLDDYTQSMSGLEYPSRWCGFWNGLADIEQGKKVELDESLCSKESNFVGSSIYRSYINQGDPTAEGVSNSEEGSVLSDRKYVDIMGRDNCVGSLSPDHFNNKSFYEPKANPMVVSLDFPRTSFLGSTSVLPETPHPRAPSLEPATNSWNYRKPQSALYEKCFRKIDSCVDDPVSKAKSSPAIVIRPPANSPSSLGVNSFSSRNMICTDNSENVSGHHLSNTEEPHIPVISEGRELYSDTSQLNGHWQRNDHLSMESSSTKKHELLNNEMGVKETDNLLRARSELQIPHLNVEDGFSFSPNSIEAVNSIDNTSETFDHYNPAVDSPCWKGSITSHFSPFEVSEALSPHNLMEQLGALDGFNLQGHHIFPLNSDDAVNVSSLKPNENTEYHKNVCGENGLLPSRKRPSVVNHPSREQRSLDAFKTGPYCQKLSSGDGNQSSNDIIQPKRDHSLLNSSKSDNLELSHTMRQSFEEVKFTSERKLSSGVGVEVTGNNINDVSGDGSSHETYHLTENISCSPLSGDDASTKLTKQPASESTPKIDVHMLINTVQDLSVLLLSHCSDNAFSLKEQDHETLKRVIDNFDACLTKKGQKIAEQGSSHFLGELPDLNKSASASWPLGKKVADANVEDQFHCQSDHKGKRHCSVSGNKDEKLSDFVSLVNDEDTVNDDSTIQAIRKILDKNFHDEEETDPQALLYRNLWLEAEAALCSISYRARFDRMKIEMKKFKLRKTEDLLKNTIDVEKQSSSKVSSDISMVDKFEREAQENPVPDITIEDSPNVTTMSHAADVVDRFHILKRRYENSDSLSSKDVGKQSSCKVSHDMNSDDNLAPAAKDDHSPNISTSTHSDDVMARFRILKCRADKSNPMNAERQQPPEEVDLEFAGKGSHWMFIKDRVEDVTLGPDLQVHIANHTKDRFDSYLDDFDCEIVKEFHEHVMDDPVIQLPRSNRLQNQLPAGFSDGSSADWEHVLKEELPGGN